MPERETPHIQLCTLLESLPEAVLIVDSSGTIVETNTPAERLIGRTRGELRGMRIADLAKVISINEDGRQLDLGKLAITRALKGEQVRNEFRTFELNEDERIEALVSANPMRDSGGHIIGALIVIRDVTETNQLQRRLADTERHGAIGHMATGIIHDFNNVLDTLEKGITVMELRADNPIEQRKAYLGMMHKAVRRGSEIVGRLRQYVKNGSGEIGIVDLKQVLEETVELAVPLLQTSNRDVKLVRDLEAVGAVRGNAADLRRTFTNLIINALQAMPTGGELTLRLERGGDGTLARVTIADTGSGIPYHQQKKIFYPYFTTKPQGTGLGLSGAQKVILSYGGSIRFHSEPGKGTKFFIELPLIAKEDRDRQQKYTGEERRKRERDKVAA